jgi:hypothetical protein
MLLHSIGRGCFSEAISYRNQCLTLTSEETEEITCPEKQSTVSHVACGAAWNEQDRSKRHLVVGYISIDPASV